MKLMIIYYTDINGDLELYKVIPYSQFSLDKSLDLVSGPHCTYSHIFDCLNLQEMKKNLMKMMKYKSSFSIAKLIITVGCLVFFVLQSHKEMKKFLSNVTSVSTQPHRRDVKIRMPRMVLCLDEPFKSDKYPDTAEEYYQSIYSKDEIIGNIFFPSGVQVTELTTFYYGSCYMLTIPEESSWIIISLNLAKDVILYLVDHGQELCIINHVAFCDVPIQGMVLKQFFHDILIRARKMLVKKGKDIHKHSLEIFIVLFP